MALTAADFKIRYPEFDTIDDARIEMFIADAQCDFDCSKLPNNDCGANICTRIICALTAHVVFIDIQTSNNEGGGAGTVQSKSVGQVSVTYSIKTSSTFEEYYKQTKYGLEYLTLLMRYCPPIITVSC